VTKINLYKIDVCTEDCEKDPPKLTNFEGKQIPKSPYLAIGFQQVTNIDLSIFLADL
jgi:hypothetical protein